MLSFLYPDRHSALFNLLIILVLGCLIGLFSACARHPADTREKIVFSSWGSAQEIAVVKQLVDEFERDNPTIHVELMHIPENYFQKLHILIAGGLTPDVMMVNSLSYADYAENHILLPLDDRLDQDPQGLKRSHFFKGALASMTYKNHLYAIPRDVSDLVVYLNLDMFQKAGVTPPSADWTMADLEAKGKALTRDDNGDGIREQFGFSFFDKPPLFWLPFVWSDGGDIFNADMTRLTLSNPQALEGLQLYADLRNRDKITPTPQEVGSANMSQLFIQGKLAMLVSGRWTTPALWDQKQLHWDVVPFPKGTHGSVVGVDSSGYAIASNSRHPDASWALVRYLSTQDAQVRFAQSGLIVPARQDVANSDVFLAPGKAPAHSRYFLDCIESGHPSQVPERWNEIAEELGLALAPVWDGTTSAREAMTQVTPKVEKMLSP